MLDVDFEYFDPSPSIDFHGLKSLLRQLFDVDNQLFDLSELTDMILAQPLLGSTVKCEGSESDPYAFLTVLNMHERRNKGVIQQLRKYLTARIVATGHADTLLTNMIKLFNGDIKDAQVGLILSERLINMPAQIVPPMYTMLQEEIQWANDEKEPYNFTHYLVVSKTYTEVASELDTEDSRPQKKAKSKSDGSSQMFYFHPEDEVLHRFATAKCSFDYADQDEKGAASDSKRAFQELGVKPKGHLILIEASKFAEAVKAVSEYLGSTA